MLLFAHMYMYASICVCIYPPRCVDSKKVWYEWCLTAPLSSPIQNCNGDTYFIGL